MTEGYFQLFLFQEVPPLFFSIVIEEHDEEKDEGKEQKGGGENEEIDLLSRLVHFSSVYAGGAFRPFMAAIPRVP